MRMRPQLSLLAYAAVAACLALPVTARAQAGATASKTVDFSAFAGGMYLNPNYASARNTFGLNLGVDVTRHIGWLLTPSLEARATRGAGPIVNERTVVFGPRVHMDFGRYHPYADILIGGGTIVFVGDPFYHEDRSTVFSYGGGLDYTLTGNFSARLDVQRTHWDLGTIHHMPFTPTQASIGITYRIPFRARRTQADINY